MNYNKIKETLESKNILINSFIKEKVGMSVHGFNQSIRNGTLQVKKLELISKHLNVPITFWWDNDDPLMVAAGETKDVKIKDIKIERLEEENEWFRELLRKREDESLKNEKREVGLR